MGLGHIKQRITMKTFKANITKNLSFGDRLKIITLSDEHRLLYNHLLEKTQCINIGADFKKLNAEYVTFRNENKLTIPSKSAQNTCISLINSIKSFYALRKKDLTHKFPHKFKSWKFFTSFMYDWNSGNGGFYFKDGYLIIRKPEISIKLPEYLASKDLSDVRTITFSGKDKKIFLSITTGSKIKPVEKTSNWLSIDPGLSSIVTAVTNTGKVIQYENCTFKRLEKSVDTLKSKRDKKKKYSKRYLKIKNTLNRKQKKLTDKRRYFHHKLTSELVDFCIGEKISTIIHGDIDTKKLTKGKYASKGLNRSTQNRGSLTRIKSFLAYKAEQAGIKYVLQNEAYTSKTNCLTGVIMSDITLSTRIINLDDDVLIDRDINGAINIAQKNLGTWSPQMEWIKKLSISKRYVVV